MYDIELRRLTYQYPDSAEPALRSVSLQIQPGEWVLLQGDTGSGKSSLLRTISGACPEFYGGRLTGSVQVNRTDVSLLSQTERVQCFGFVGQDPEAQQVYATVGREVAFALENLAISPQEMEWRVAEALEMVGLSSYTDADIRTLSGGQRQRLMLAASLVHQPGILLLDEPTSQLDPVACEEWFDVLRRLNEEFGLSIIMSEHRIDRAYQVVHRVIYMEQGQVQFDGAPRRTAAWLRTKHPESVPTLGRLGSDETQICLSVRDVRIELFGGPPLSKGFNARGSLSTFTEETQRKLRHKETEGLVLALKGVSCMYPGTSRYALDECTLSLYDGQITAVIGPNGAGKSTLLRLLCGLQAPLEGSFEGRVVSGKRKAGPRLGDPKIGYLPQNPNDLLSQETIEEEILYSLGLRGEHGRDARDKTDQILDMFNLLELRHRHPRDVSGGERMRVALATVMVTQPELLLVDEPTRGMDATQKYAFGERLKASGKTVVVATHDMEFVAEYADQVVFLNQGKVVLRGTPRDVFRHALYFAPPIARAMRLVDPDILCLSDAISAGWAQ